MCLLISLSLPVDNEAVVLCFGTDNHYPVSKYAVLPFLQAQTRLCYQRRDDTMIQCPRLDT